MAYTRRALTRSTIFFATSGNKPSNAKETSSAGDRMPLSESMLRELRAGVHVDDRARQHAELTDPVEGARLDRRQPHDQVDHEERKDRHQPQGEQVERAFALDACVDARSRSPNLRWIASRNRKRLARNASVAPMLEANDTMHRAPQQAEDGAPDQRQNRGARQRQPGDRDVHDEIKQRGLPRMRLIPGLDCRLLRLEEVEGEEALQAKDKERSDQRHEHQYQHEPRASHRLRLPLIGAGGLLHPTSQRRGAEDAKGAEKPKHWETNKRER